MLAHSELISTREDIVRLAEKLRQSDTIAFDTEFIRENTFYPVVEIIQVATADESWLVDARAFFKNREDLRPLLDIFEDRKILKIAHASQGDQECIYTSFGVLAVPCFDTAIGASLCGYGDGVGLGNLLKSALGVTIKKGHARTNWSVRPLPQQLLEYALVDVEYLVALGKKILAELDQLKRRDWAMEASAKFENPALYDSDPEGLAQKLAKGGRVDKKTYAALVELMRWRETRVRELNLPRRWVADDNVVLDLAQVKPKDLAHLGAFRGLNKGELKNSGEQILAAIRRSHESTDLVVPRMPRPDIPTAAESQVLDLLKCYVGILSDRHRVALKYLVTSAQLLPLLRAQARVPEDLARDGLLNEPAARLIGDEVIAFLSGRRALSISGTQVKIVEIDPEFQQAKD